MISDRITKIIEHYFGSGRGSITRFAEKLNLKTGLIGNWLSGSVEPSAKYRNKICDTFSVSNKWLDTGVGEMIVEPISPAPSQSRIVNITDRDIGRLEGEIVTLKDAIARYEIRLDKYDIQILTALKACAAKGSSYEKKIP